MFFRRALIVLCTAVLVASCGAQSTVPAPVSPDAARPHHLPAHLKISVRIQSRHRAHYLSVSSKGMTLALTGPTSLNEALGLTPASDPNCHNVSGTTTCTFMVAVLSGSYSANVSIYDQPPAGSSIPPNAKLLSTAKNLPMTVVLGQANNANFTLDGVVANLTIGILPAGVTGASFGPQTFNVTAKDADGNTIVGRYENAVTLSNSDSSGATTLATSGTDSPPANMLESSSDTATLSYNGNASVSATISASATGATGDHATFVPAPIISAPAELGSNYATVDSGSAVSITTTASAPAGASVIVATLDTLWGSGNLATSIACSDSAGNTYTSDVFASGGGQSTAICSAHNITSLPNGSMITVTWAGQATQQDYFIAAYSVTGLASSALDRTAASTANSASPSSGTTATTAQAHELLFGVVSYGSADTGFIPGSNGTANACSTSGTPAYSNPTLQPPFSGITLWPIYCVVNATGTYAATGTKSFAEPWVDVLATYKGAP